MSAVSNGRAFHYHLMGYWMTMELDREEPSAGRWRVERIADVVNAFAERARTGAGRPLVLAIDGRSSSGKTTLAGRVADTVSATAVVHTDDIAWSHSRFGWADLALCVLELVHAGGVIPTAKVGRAGPRGCHRGAGRHPTPRPRGRWLVS
jgi:hypothetical protein